MAFTNITLNIMTTIDTHLVELLVVMQHEQALLGDEAQLERQSVFSLQVRSDQVKSDQVNKKKRIHCFRFPTLTESRIFFAFTTPLFRTHART